MTANPPLDIALSWRPLRILQVLEPSGGGSGRHFLDLCAGLRAMGHEVTAVYSPLRAERAFVEELSSIPLKAVHPVPMRRAPHPSDIMTLRQLRQIVRKEGPFDIIHGHSSKAGYLVRLSLPGFRHTPRVYTPHAFRTMDPTIGAASRFIFGTVESVLGRFFTDRLICVSADERAHATALGIPDRVLATVVNGVRKPETAKRNEIRTRLGFTTSNFVFGFIGRLAAQKAPERLIEAFARVSHAFPQARLLMIGSGELEAGTRALIDSLGIAAKVVLTRDIPGSMAVQAFDALVMPSRYEAMSYAMLEAAASGKPMVLTDVGGARTVVDNGINGRIVKNTDDPAELADAMLEFAAPEHAKAYAVGAFVREDRFQLEKMVQRTLAVYADLCGLAPMPVPIPAPEVILSTSPAGASPQPARKSA